MTVPERSALPGRLRVTRRFVLFAALAVLWGCGDDDGPPPDASDRCTTDEVCSDALFCNGIERCRPDDPAADVLGCVAEASACLEGQRCDEDADRCESLCGIRGDADGDGHDAVECGGDDCDDTDPDVSPGRTEVCDAEGIDEDCDPSTFGFRDTDGDGIGDAACCNGDACDRDCDDGRLSRRPGQLEICDDVDNDCDGSLDEEMNEVPWYEDADGDGFGGDTVVATSCEPIPGASLVSTDCDDENRAISPVGFERCDGVDNDCDEEVDEECTNDGGMPDGGVSDGSIDVDGSVELDGGIGDDAGPCADIGGGELCDDGCDNNGDGRTDCLDLECSFLPTCMGTLGEPCGLGHGLCADGLACSAFDYGVYDMGDFLDAGVCVPARAPEQACDPTGVADACLGGEAIFGYGPLCSEAGICRGSCAFDTGDGLCADIDSQARGLGVTIPWTTDGTCSASSRCDLDAECRAGVCVRVGSCEAPIVVPIPGAGIHISNVDVRAATPTSRADHQSIYCASTTGADVAFSLTPPADGVLHVSFVGTSGSALYHRDECDSLVSETACSTMDVDYTSSPYRFSAALPPIIVSAGTAETVFLENSSDSEIASGSLHVRFAPYAARGATCDPEGLVSVCRAGDRCSTATSRCVEDVCGDGFAAAGDDACDDGNTMGGDGCSSSCTIEVFDERTAEPNDDFPSAVSIGNTLRVAGSLTSGADWYDYLALPELAGHESEWALVLRRGADGRCNHLGIDALSTAFAVAAEGALDSAGCTRLEVPRGAAVVRVSGFVSAEYAIDVERTRRPLLARAAECSPDAWFGSDRGTCATSTDICSPTTNTCVASTCGDGVRHPVLEACDDGNVAAGDGCVACAWVPTMESEPNTLPAVADPVLSVPHQRLAGTLSSHSDIDYWRISLATPARVRVEELTDACSTVLFTDAAGDYTPYLGMLVEGFTNNCGETSGFASRALPAGDHYLAIGEGVGAYEFALDILSVDERAVGENCDAQAIEDLCASGLRCHPRTERCVTAGCGDGVLSDMEECDDGNVTSGDGCSSCTLDAQPESEPNDTVATADVLTFSSTPIDETRTSRHALFAGRVPETTTSSVPVLDHAQFVVPVGTEQLKVHFDCASGTAPATLLLFRDDGRPGPRGLEHHQFVAAFGCEEDPLSYPHAGDYLLRVVTRPGGYPAADYRIRVSMDVVE